MMLKTHERFHSANGKRLILVADDELINREILRSILQDDYELIFAENGQVALEKIRENRETLSLVLLDLMMPVLSGIEVLKQAKVDPETANVLGPGMVVDLEHLTKETASRRATSSPSHTRRRASSLRASGAPSSFPKTAKSSTQPSAIRSPACTTANTSTATPSSSTSTTRTWTWTPSLST